MLPCLPICPLSRSFRKCRATTVCRPTCHQGEIAKSQSAPIQQRLQRLIVVAVAIALRRGDVAILVIVVLARRRRRFLWFAVVLLGKLTLFAGSTHDVPSDRMHRDLDESTSISPRLTGILALVGQSFLPFSGVQCKGRHNRA